MNRLHFRLLFIEALLDLVGGELIDVLVDMFLVEEDVFLVEEDAFLVEFDTLLVEEDALLVEVDK